MQVSRWADRHAFRVRGRMKRDRGKLVNIFRGAALTLLFLTMLTGCAALAQAPAEHKTQHIIFVMTDGLRWQEVFGGADATLMNKKNGQGPDEAALATAYWRGRG